LTAAREIWCADDDARFVRGLFVPDGAEVVDLEQLAVTALFPGGILALRGDGTVILEPREMQNRLILQGAQAIAAWSSDACAVLGDASVSCWELNTSKHLEIEPIQGIGTATKVSVGGLWACALRGDGSLACWRNLHTRRDVSRPAKEPWTVPIPGGLLDIALSGAFGCAIDRSRFVWCWGDNRRHVVSEQNVEDVGAARRMDGVSGAVAIRAGDEHVCALSDDGGVLCWGDNTYGECGADEAHSPTIDRSSRAPKHYARVTRVPEVTDVVDVSTGSGYSCALERSGRVLCWGGILQRARDAAAKPSWIPIAVAPE
jgi:alpha-tubulin suppressor-like RCC1 family protein